MSPTSLCHRLIGLELSLPMLGVAGAAAPVTDVGVLEHKRNDAVKEFFSFLPGVLVNGVQLGHTIGPSAGIFRSTTTMTKRAWPSVFMKPEIWSP